MLQAIIMMVAVAATPTASPPQETSPDPVFLDEILVVEADPAAGEITFTDLEGEARTLREGDVIEEVSARVKKITRTTLVLTRVVKGGDGREGEALIVVRFDPSGKTKVREYRTVPDVSLKAPPRDDP